MKKLSVIFTSILMVLLLSGCGNSPGKVAKVFAESLANGNFEEAKKYSTEQTIEMLELTEELGTIDMIDDDYSFKLVKETINGEKAIVKQKNGHDIHLVKVDGNWKVDLQK